MAPKKQRKRSSPRQSPRQKRRRRRQKGRRSSQRRSPRRSPRQKRRRSSPRRVGIKHKNPSTYGSRAQVMHDNALQTTGGLTKKDLKYNKDGKIVSRRRSEWAKKVNHLEGYLGQGFDR